MIDAEKSYLRTLFVFMVVSAIYAVGGLCAFSLIVTLGSLSSSPEGSPAMSLHIALAPSHGMAAIGVLATITIALQVSARMPRGTPAIAEELARQRVFGYLAYLCAIGAMVVAVSTVLSQTVPNPGNAWHSWAPLGGGLLVTAVAADAVMAGEAQIDARVARQLRSQARALHRLLVQHYRKLPTAAWSFGVQAVVVALLLAGPAVAARLISGTAESSIWFAIITLILVVPGLAFVEARDSWLMRDRVSAVTLAGVMTCATVAIATVSMVLTLAIQRGPLEARIAVSASLTIASTALPLLAVAIATSADGFLGRRTIGSSVFARRHARLAVMPSRRAVHIRWIAIGLIASSIALAPLGLWWSCRLRRNDPRVSARTIIAARIIGGCLTATLACSLAWSAVANLHG